ncbi:MAG TPA: lipoprotein [Noviherbaspirillum sp.]|uniref:LPS translocon maturation chaperone LptM n=1 Tax=Noviherbaspirillum sp. TaxID=1926288 RepID=UPI002DDD85EE|nr:lipoprotein [Noviherbaspirillum sp.]HEV2609687.1 lipoprotein [Noviherbaspirillum sp.]
MKFLSDFRRLALLVVVMTSTGVLGACGQKGPLFLPAKPQPTAPAAKPAQTAPTQDPAPASK